MILREIDKEAVFTSEFRSTSPTYFLDVLRNLATEAPPNAYGVTLLTAAPDDKIIPDSELWLSYNYDAKMFLPQFPDRPGDFESRQREKEARRAKFLADIKEAAIGKRKIKKIKYWSTNGAFDVFMKDLDGWIDDGHYFIGSADLQSPDGQVDTGMKLRYENEVYFAKLQQGIQDKQDALTKWISILQKQI